LIYPTEYTKEEWIAGVNQSGKQFAVGFLGVEVIDVDDESLTVRIPITNKVLQSFGILHGGINLFLAETAASMHATWRIDLNKKIPVGIEVNASHVRSVKSGAVLAIAKVVRKSTHLAVHNVDIVHEESGKVISSARVTNFYKEVKDEK